MTVLVNAAALWAATELVPGVDFLQTDPDLHWAMILAVAGALFGLVNFIVKPLIKVLSFPLYLLTFGLFALVVNALMLMATSWLSEQLGNGLVVDGFESAMLGGIVVSIALLILTALLPKKYRPKRR
jgi:putative membrane protein